MLTINDIKGLAYNDTLSAESPAEATALGEILEIAFGESANIIVDLMDNKILVESNHEKIVEKSCDIAEKIGRLVEATN
jgi:chemotaxis protein CheY-P-specific phosphatase CheC